MTSVNMSLISSNETILGPVPCHDCHLLVTLHRDWAVRDWSRFPALRGGYHECTGVRPIDIEKVEWSNYLKKRRNGFAEDESPADL